MSLELCPKVSNVPFFPRVFGVMFQKFLIYHLFQEYLMIKSFILCSIFILYLYVQFGPKVPALMFQKFLMYLLFQEYSMLKVILCSICIICSDVPYVLFVPQVPTGLLYPVCRLLLMIQDRFILMFQMYHLFLKYL